MTRSEKNKKFIENVVLYIRVSSQEQAMFGFSLEAQKNALVKYAEENGMKVVGIYTDEGLSARSKLHQRKALWQSCLEQVFWHHISENICLLCVSVLHFCIF